MENALSLGPSIKFLPVGHPILQFQPVHHPSGPFISRYGSSLRPYSRIRTNLVSEGRMGDQGRDGQRVKGTEDVRCKVVRLDRVVKKERNWERITGDMRTHHTVHLTPVTHEPNDLSLRFTFLSSHLILARFLVSLVSHFVRMIREVEKHRTGQP